MTNHLKNAHLGINARGVMDVLSNHTDILFLPTELYFYKQTVQLGMHDDFTFTVSLLCCCHFRE